MKGIHLDVDRVLMGQGLTVTLDTVSIFGVMIPRALVIACTLFTINLVCLVVLWKELKLALFDAGLAATLGFAPVLIHYGLMTSVSLTTVAAFDAVGPVLVLAFFAVPAATARLLTDRFAVLILLSVLIAVIAAALGSWLTFELNTTIAGTIAVMLGAIFAVVFLIAPERGLIAQSLRRFRQRRSFHETMLLVHLLSHEGTEEEADESSEARLPHHLAWTATNVNALAARVESQGLVLNDNRLWKLTTIGRARARESLSRPSFDA
jgi:manganese/zinc/iron transport system permease protein